MKVKFETTPMVNDFGAVYGVKYRIVGPQGVDFIDLQEELIENEIGQEYYYSTRDAWDQIEIVDARS